MKKKFSIFFLKYFTCLIFLKPFSSGKLPLIPKKVLRNKILFMKIFAIEPLI